MSASSERSNWLNRRTLRHSFNMLPNSERSISDAITCSLSLDYRIMPAQHKPRTYLSGNCFRYWNGLL
jgi:hypothetical protein